MKNVYLKIRLVPVIILFGLFSFTATAVADIAVIVNSASGISSLSASKAKKIFLGKTKKLPNGKTAQPVEQAEDSTVRAAFNDKVLGKSDSQYKAYWSKIIFSGKGSPPQSATDDAAVKAFVASHVNAIGYIDSGAADTSVTVVLTVK